MSAIDPEMQRLNLSMGLVYETGPARGVVSVDGFRTLQLIQDDCPADFLTAEIARELADSRQFLRDNILDGIDDVAVDTYLRVDVDEENSLLPPLFRQLRAQAQEGRAEPLTFIKWMADCATDDQLLNVWQWHHDYLTRHNDNPVFVEQVQSRKARYLKGVRAAIGAGVLHPDMAVDEVFVDRVVVAHGSPLSSALATCVAFADYESKSIQTRPDGLDGLAFYHEFSHVLWSGLMGGLDESTTDVIAATVDEYAGTSEHSFDPELSPYNDEHVTLNTLLSMTGGQVGILELSAAYAHSSRHIGTLALLRQIDDSIGLPVATTLMVGYIKTIKEYMDTHDGSVVRRLGQMIMRSKAEFLAAVIETDADGNADNSVLQLLTRAATPAVIGKLGVNHVASELTTLVDLEQQRRFQQGN